VVFNLRPEVMLSRHTLDKTGAKKHGDLKAAGLRRCTSNERLARPAMVFKAQFTGFELLGNYFKEWQK